jgi:hypothetical protein
MSENLGTFVMVGEDAEVGMHCRGERSSEEIGTQLFSVFAERSGSQKDQR